jgi:hypothetical protein
MVVFTSPIPDYSTSLSSSPRRCVEDDREIPDRNGMIEYLSDEIQCEHEKLEALYYEESMRIFTQQEVSSKIGEVRQSEKSFNRERVLVDGASLGVTAVLATAGVCICPIFLPLAVLALVPCLAEERRAQEYIPAAEKELTGLNEKLEQSKVELEAIEAQKKRVEEHIRAKENALSILTARGGQRQQSPPAALFSEGHN